MANLVAMIGNGGTVYRPHVLLEVRDPQTREVLRRVGPETLAVSHLRTDTFRSIRKAMRSVVTDGTAGPVITTEAVQTAGNTATAEVGLSESWHSWFVGYGPYGTDDPEEMVVVVVMVEAENEWEWWAPKAANVIFHGIFTGQSYAESLETLRPWWYVQRLQRERASER